MEVSGLAWVAEFAFYLVASLVLLLSWTSRAATPDPPAHAAKLGLPSLGRLSPNLNGGSFLVFLAIYFGTFQSNWVLSWLLLALAAIVCPKPLEVDVVWFIVKSACPGSQARHETMMLDLMRIARELAAKQGMPKDSLIDAIKVEIPFATPFFVLIDPHYVHMLHAAPTVEFFRTDYQAGAWFIGPNLLTMKSPPMKNPKWQFHRAMTAPVNMDRNGPQSVMGQMLVTGIAIMSRLSRELGKKKHGGMVDIVAELEYIVVTAHLGAMFGEEYVRRYPRIADDVNFTAIKYSTISNGSGFKVWSPTEGLHFLAARRRIVASLEWAIKEGDSVLLDMLRKSRKEGKISDAEHIGTALLFTYALAPSRTTIFAVCLLANLPHEQEKVAAEVRTKLNSVFNEETGEVDMDKAGEWVAGLDKVEALSRCVRETLRMYPGVPMFIPQLALQNIQIGPWQVPKDALTLSFPFLTQRDARWHPEPDKYDPSRNLEKGAPLPDGTSTYFPFAMGPRSCQGQFYGELLVRGAVAIMIRDHTLEAKDPVPPPAMLGFIQPMVGAWAKITAPPPLEQPKTKAAAPMPASTKKATFSSVKSVKFVPVINDIDFITIIFASTQGNSRAFAERLARGLRESDIGALDKVPSFRVCDAADYPMDKLSRESLVLFVTSTFGYKEPPHNGAALKAFVMRQDVALPRLHYSVLALGNSVYPSFCSFGMLLDEKLEGLGGHRLMPVALCDEIEGQEGAFVEYLEQISDVLYSALRGPELLSLPSELPSHGAASSIRGLAPSAPPTTVKKVKRDPRRVDEGQSLARFQLVELGQGAIASRRAAGPIKTGAKPGSQEYPVELQVIANRCLRPYTSLVQTRNIILRTPADGSIDYEPGDLIGVYPVNRLDMVTTLAARLGITNLDTEFELRPLPANKDSLQPPLPGKMTYWLALTSYLAIARVPTPNVMKVLQQYTSDEEEAAWLNLMAAGGPKYTEYAMGGASLLETLYKVPSCKPNVGHLVETLPQLRPRLYSLSSSMAYRPGEAQLTVAEVIYETEEKGWRRGVCSTYLGSDFMIPSSTADQGSHLLGFVVPNPGFRMPKDVTTPIVMIGIGTGMSPFRGFWQQRLALIRDAGASLGPAVLYSGFQTAANACYLEEVEEAVKAEALTNARFVFSREGERKYVTHALTEDRYTLWHDYLSKGAVVYVCGTIDAAKDVRAVIQEVVSEAGGMSDEDAAAWLESAADNGLYKEDVFGESVKTFAKTRMAARLRAARSKLRTAFSFLGAKGIAKILENQ